MKRKYIKTHMINTGSPQFSTCRPSSSENGIDLMEVNRSISGKSRVFLHVSTLMEQPQWNIDSTMQCIRGELRRVCASSSHIHTHKHINTHLFLAAFHAVLSRWCSRLKSQLAQASAQKRHVNSQAKIRLVCRRHVWRTDGNQFIVFSFPFDCALMDNYSAVGFFAVVFLNNTTPLKNGSSHIRYKWWVWTVRSSLKTAKNLRHLSALLHHSQTLWLWWCGGVRLRLLI